MKSLGRGDVRDFPAFSSERMRLLCKIVDVVVEACNIAIELAGDRGYSSKKPNIEKPYGVGIIEHCGNVFVIVARSYIEERVRESGIGHHRNTLREVMKKFINSKISGMNIVEGMNNLIKFFVERCNRDRSNMSRDSAIKELRYELRQQLERLPPNTWFVVIDANELRSSLEYTSVAMFITQYIREVQRYERLDTIMKLLQDEGVYAIMLEDVLVACAIIKLMGSSTATPDSD